jgi:hypothetical protein
MTARQANKQQPLLGNGSVNVFPWQRIPTQQQSYCWKQCFLLNLCKGVIKEDNWGDPISWQLSSARVAEKRWHYSSVVGYSLDSNDVSTEAEGSPFLKAVTEQ